MIRWIPATGRNELRFDETVIREFDFLQHYGFKCVQREVTRVRYESSRVYVNVYHGRGSYELNVEVGRLEGPDTSYVYDLDMILGWAGAQERKLLERTTPLFQAETAETVREAIFKMSRLFNKYASALLRGDESAFADLRAFSQREDARMREHYRRGTTRYMADMAWQQGDWKQVVALYESIKNDLTQIEAAELARAKTNLLASLGAS